MLIHHYNNIESETV